MADLNKTNDPVLRELIDIKRLLVLQLLVEGVGQAQIARALGTHQSTVSRLVPGIRVAKKG